MLVSHDSEDGMQAGTQVSGENRPGSKVSRQFHADNELAAISRTVNRLKSDPQALQKAMQKAGILTETGHLSENYRS
jgi:hypothetical protein